METGVQNSFIPHDASQPTSGRRERDGSLSGLIMLVSIVLLVASLALAAGVFLYQQYLEKSSTSKINQLKIAKAQFDPSLIEVFSRLDDRMRDADTILGSHIAPSVFFHMLEANTLKTVSFRSLDFEAGSEEGMAVKMEGIAESVNSIALQADFFSKVGIIKNPIFSNIDRQIDGVHFSFSASVNPSAIGYVQAVAGAGDGTGSAAPVPSVPSGATTLTPATTPEPVPAPPSGFFPSQPVNQQ